MSIAIITVETNNFSNPPYIFFFIINSRKSISKLEIWSARLFDNFLPLWKKKIKILSFSLNLCVFSGIFQKQARFNIIYARIFSCKEITFKKSFFFFLYRYDLHRLRRYVSHYQNWWKCGGGLAKYIGASFPKNSRKNVLNKFLLKLTRIM